MRQFVEKQTGHIEQKQVKGETGQIWRLMTSSDLTFDLT